MKTAVIINQNKRLKQLVKQHGEEWEVLWGPEPMQCFNNSMGVHIRSLDGSHRRNIPLNDIFIILQTNK